MSEYSYCVVSSQDNFTLAVLHVQTGLGHHNAPHKQLDLQRSSYSIFFESYKFVFVYYFGKKLLHECTLVFFFILQQSHPAECYRYRATLENNMINI